MTVREIALKLLCEWEECGKYVNLSLSSHLTDNLTKEEKSLLTALVYTAVENKITYDYYVSSLSKRPIEKLDLTTKNILRLGIAQILKMEKIPDFASVNESVKLAKNKGSRAFVNAILHKVIENRDNLPLPDRNKNVARYLSVKYSFSLFITKKLVEVFGESEAEKILLSYSEIAPTDIAVNTTRVEKSAYILDLLSDGIIPQETPMCQSSLRIDGSIDPRTLLGYEDGHFFVQGLSSASAVSVLAPKKNDTVIDVCSAPGGKSFLSAILMQNCGRVISFDIHESKLSLIENGRDRLGLSIIEVAQRDATCADHSLYNVADKVICDVPCSGLGVLNKKPDMRYKTADGVDKLPDLQLQILTEASKYVKDGGKLLYSTCTLIPLENGGVVTRFLSTHPEFVRTDFKCGEYESENGELTLLPHVHKTDGFYIALLTKRG